MINPASWDIRARTVLIAVLPTMVMATVLIAYFTSSRLSDLEEAHVQRGKALARQLAAASEYGVFSGNLESLRKLANSILQEQDVVRVAVFSPIQEVLADSSKPVQPATTVSLAPRYSDTPLRFREPVTGPGVNLDDPFLEAGTNGSHPPEDLHGEVLVEMSRESLRAEESRLLQNAFSMVVAVLIASVALALRMSRGISGPILRIASTVESFGQGNLSDRVPVEGGKSLRALAQGVNDMADKLGASREHMERQIEAATRELLVKKEEAEHGNRAKTRFLAAASHDLRQPMHALGLFVAELGQKQHAPDTHRLVAQIAVSAETMENLLDSLLDISRLDAGVLDRQIKPFPLQPLFERIDVDYRREADQRSQRLRLRPTNLWVESDPLLLERILHNLISNALRYAPGGTILLACRKRGDKVRIEVRDNGPGIAREAQDTIFQEFVQLDNPERNRAKGLGLGLAIVRRLTNLLEHDLSLRSTPGRGALFAVELRAAKPGLIPEGIPPPPAHSLYGRHIVLVDDDELAVASTTGLLESWGCQVTAAASLELILSTIDEHAKPDIIVCDYQSGSSVDGLAIIERLRAHFGQRVPAIILSGDTSAAVTDNARQAGIPLLHKPVRPAKLRALLQRKTQV
ncbi:MULTISPECIES: ATP-binding protein [Zoogloea]|jgi:signal transduction histidine kinase/CheY-like chemotaxis protein|uniref:histidine kinase n=1 Tax=Zoogloea oleivorans TaxID=1552750 RepID=A0A6C2D520_9RHOO|nr:MULTISPECIES: ATP-binding protein [Zoogloea]MDD2667585.1 ATP-binding protein [Zoogloea sp.]TYC61427.1 response regulator [Zoogloea oleivorans]